MILEAKFNEVNSEMSAEFGTVSVVYEDEAWTDGYNTGYVDGNENGYSKGFEDGKAEGGGGDELFKYAKVCNSLFADASFPDGFEMVADIPNVATDIGSMFRRAMGMKKLTFIVPTTKTYNASYFYYGTSSIKPTVEEIVLPDGIKFSDFSRFVGYCESLKTISGSIDLSECTTVLYCFMNCYDLEEVRFMPRTIGLSLDLASCSKLTDASIQSIINGLDYNATGQTLTVHPNVAAKITETDVTDAGWSLAYKGKVT